MSYKYKTKDGTLDGFVPGAGAIVDGFITSAFKLENPNLEFVSEVNETAPEPIVGTVSQSNEQINPPATPPATEN